MDFLTITSYAWLVMWCFWLITAVRTKATLKRQTGISRIIYLALVLLAFAMIYSNRISTGWMHHRFVPDTILYGTIGLVINLSGIIFAIMARIWLAGNWSGSITLKKNHELIVSGPYAITRHPIYTGILFGLIGSAMVLGESRGIIAAVILFIALHMKINAEEKLLRSAFDNYNDYANRTQRLVPFIY